MKHHQRLVLESLARIYRILEHEPHENYEEYEETIAALFESWLTVEGIRYPIISRYELENYLNLTLRSQLREEES
jgi:hypothetical protein